VFVRVKRKNGNMAILQQDIDYGEFDGLIAEKILREEFGGEYGRAVLLKLIAAGATTVEIAGRLRRLLPTWEGTAAQLEVVTDYLIQERGGRANGRGASQ
jgi:hypothetical protein